MNNLAKKNDKKYKYFIYKIYNPECDYIYVGSTRDMVSRKHRHKSDCNNVNSPSYNYKVYKTIRDNGGFENFHIVVLEIMPHVTKLQAEIQEDVYRLDLHASMNSKKATRGDITVAEYYKQYQIDNKQHISERKKQYRIQNKEHITQHQNQKQNCDCGGKFTKQNKLQHNKSNKHQKYISNLNN